MVCPALCWSRCQGPSPGRAVWDRERWCWVKPRGDRKQGQTQKGPQPPAQGCLSPICGVRDGVSMMPLGSQQWNSVWCNLVEFSLVEFNRLQAQLALSSL